MLCERYILNVFEEQGVIYSLVVVGAVVVVVAAAVVVVVSELSKTILIMLIYQYSDLLLPKSQ